MLRWPDAHIVGRLEMRGESGQIRPAGPLPVGVLGGPGAVTFAAYGTLPNVTRGEGNHAAVAWAHVDSTADRRTARGLGRRVGAVACKSGWYHVPFEYREMLDAM
jgi:hypothetical protein